MEEGFEFFEIENSLNLEWSEMQLIELNWENVKYNFKNMFPVINENLQRDYRDVSYLDFLENTFIKKDNHIYFLSADKFLHIADSVLHGAIERSNLSSDVGTYYLFSVIRKAQRVHVQHNFSSLIAFHRVLDEIYSRLSLLYRSNDYARELVHLAESELRMDTNKQLAMIDKMLDTATTIVNIITSRKFAQSKAAFVGMKKLQCMPNELLIGISYADLAYHNFKNANKYLRADDCRNFIRQGRFKFFDRYSGILCRDDGNRRILAFKGTIPFSPRDWWTNIYQFLFGANSTYKCGLGMVIDLLKDGEKINIYGHSLGGGMTQFCIGALQCDSNNLMGYGYNSAGLSDYTMAEIGSPKNISNMLHLHVQNDPVMILSGYHLGDCYEVKSNKKCPHRIKDIRKETSNKIYCGIV
jgi:hypothetical protein